ncbi:aminoglycoside adenylyltransferase family protein [Citrobacter sp. Ct235]|uniref:aminoglycoside adenylyltransferase family protein n=1 Tax=Citrobacter sp. Ct235 TaxID=2985157 RepID=UPI00257559C1|nr:aminoglycoside adenylyltransferase family protein [Citrobacter sp. Ct235]MDM2738020.1 aminoglycoside adenylyltransferase family protein [Citrobacter sp. Ct235]
MTSTMPDTLRNQLEKAKAIIARILEDSLLAIHLYGSAVEGGLKPYSDIDLLVTTRVPLTTAQREALMQELLLVSAGPGSSALWRALEVTVVVHGEVVPWRFPPRREMQFGEWLREDIHAGKYEPAQQDSDLAILITQARSASIALSGERADLLFEPVPENDIRETFRQTLMLWQNSRDLQGDERNIILTLARIWYSVATGGFTAKDSAADWLLPYLPDEHASLLATARLDYLGQVSVDWAEVMPAVSRFVCYAKAKIAEPLLSADK